MVGFNLFNGFKFLNYCNFRIISRVEGGRVPRTGYHLVDPRPWPIIVRAGVINEAASFIRFVHNGNYTVINFFCAT